MEYQKKLIFSINNNLNVAVSVENYKSHVKNGIVILPNIEKNIDIGLTKWISNQKAIWKLLKNSLLKEKEVIKICNKILNDLELNDLVIEFTSQEMEGRACYIEGEKIIFHKSIVLLKFWSVIELILHEISHAIIFECHKINTEIYRLTTLLVCRYPNFKFLNIKEHAILPIEYYAICIEFSLFNLILKHCNKRHYNSIVKMLTLITNDVQQLYVAYLL